MSLRYEQYTALKRSEVLLHQEFSRRIKWRNRFRHIPILRRRLDRWADEVYYCLRHFPFLHESGQPIFSRDPFTKDHS